MTTDEIVERAAQTRDALNGKLFGGGINDMTDQMEKAVNRAKAAVSEKIDDGRVAAERLLRRGKYVFEDGVDAAVHQVKRNPVNSVLIAFAAGALVGLVVPRLGRRSRS